MIGADQLTLHAAAGDTTVGIVLVLHGGTDKPAAAVKPMPQRTWLVPWKQTERIARGLAGRFVDQGIAVWVLRHSLAGWDSDVDPSPVREALEALDLITAGTPETPVVLVGHSMGARTAVRVADHPEVLGVIGLAPWLPEHEEPARLAHKSLAVAHAKGDWICSWRQMQSFVERAEADAAVVRVESMGWDLHVLVKEPRWHDFAARHALEMFRTRTT